MAQDLTLRGKLAKVAHDDSADLYTAPTAASRISYAIQGGLSGKYVGTLTGNKTTLPGGIELLEVVCIGYVPGVSYVVPGQSIALSMLWVNRQQVLTEINPKYVPATDTGRDDYVAPSPTNTAPGTTPPDDVVDTDPGKKTLPIDDGTGKVRYVSEEQLKAIMQEILNGVNGTKDPATTDTAKKYLTWAVWGLVGLAVVTLVVILVKTVRKPKNS